MTGLGGSGGGSMAQGVCEAPRPRGFSCVAEEGDLIGVWVIGDDGPEMRRQIMAGCVWQ